MKLKSRSQRISDVANQSPLPEKTSHWPETKGRVVPMAHMSILVQVGERRQRLCGDASENLNARLGPLLSTCRFTSARAKHVLYVAPFPKAEPRLPYVP